MDDYRLTRRQELLANRKMRQRKMERFKRDLKIGTISFSISFVVSSLITIFIRLATL